MRERELWEREKGSTSLLSSSFKDFWTFGLDSNKWEHQGRIGQIILRLLGLGFGLQVVYDISFYNILVP